MRPVMQMGVAPKRAQQSTVNARTGHPAIGTASATVALFSCVDASEVHWCVGVCRFPMPRNVQAAANPHLLMRLNVV
jgi:hypothetical protein